MRCSMSQKSPHMLTSFNNQKQQIEHSQTLSFAERGYAILPSLYEKELEVLRTIIRNKYLKTLEDFHIFDFKNDEFKQPFNYHNLSIENHSEIWGKQQRIFSEYESEEFLKFSLFDYLKNQFGFLKVADIEGIGYPEIYWRIVRPNKTEDVSGIHADSWFFTHTNKMTPKEQDNLLKIWIPIEVLPNEGGLGVYPGSHLKKWDYDTIKKDGRIKPKLNYLPNHEKILLPLKPGEPVIFDKNLLHYGVSHKADYTRVSIEFAIQVS